MNRNNVRYCISSNYQREIVTRDLKHWFSGGYCIVESFCCIIIQLVIGNIIDPAIMGKSLNLSIFMILISLSFWGFIWGVVGMFLAISLLVATAILFSHIDETKWIAILLSADEQLLIEQTND